MKTDFQQWGGADPEMINRALEAQGSTYRVPVPQAVQPTPPQRWPGALEAPPEAAAPTAPAAPQTLEDIYAQQAADATARAPAEAIAAGAVPPAARMSLAQPQMAPQPARRPSVGGGAQIANPIPGMLKEASAGKAAAETQRDQAELGYDTATEARKLNAETLGDSKADNLESIAEVQARIAADQREYHDRLQVEADSHTAATDKVNSERNEMIKFVNEYEPKDRRTGKQRVAGAIAVGLSGMLDQNNLVAGLMQGMNVQTSNADRTASLIQKGIERDLEYQRALLDNKQTAMAGKTTELGQLREKYGDTVDTLKLARAMKIEQAQKEIEATTAQGASQEARILGQEASDKLEQEKQAIYSEVYGKRFESLRGEEQKLRMARYEQQRAAQAGANPMTALKLREQQLKNAKMEQELNKTDKGGPATEGERKTYGVISGAKDSFKRLYSTVYNSDGTEKNPDDVDMPARAWNYVPTILTPEAKEQQRLDDTNIVRTLLRIESGSNVPDSEVEGKMYSTGLTSSDESVRAKARKALLEQLQATDQWGLLDDAKPNPLTRPHEAK